MPQAVRRVGIPKGSSPQYNHWQWKLATGASTLLQPRVSVKPRQKFWEKMNAS